MAADGCCLRDRLNDRPSAAAFSAAFLAIIENAGRYSFRWQPDIALLHSLNQKKLEALSRYLRKPAKPCVNDNGSLATLHLLARG
jgi:hypothetical protein